MTERTEFKFGDVVQSKKGCRFKGPGGKLRVLETGKKWGEFDAVLCEKEDGSRRLYLCKNLKLEGK